MNIRNHISYFIILILFFIMQNQLFSFKQKGFLLIALFLSLGFCVQAQQSNHANAGTTSESSATTPVTIIYSSQFNQMSQPKQDYIKAHPEQFTITTDPIQGTAVSPTTETFTTPDGQVMPGKAPAAMANRPTPIKPQVAQPSQMPPSGKMTQPGTEGVSKKAMITRVEFNQMSTEKQQFIQTHTDQFDIVE